MTLLLSARNIGDYLVRLGFCDQQERDQLTVEPVVAKNFNLVVMLPDGRKLLIKQERYLEEGQTAGEFRREWWVQEFFRRFLGLEPLRPQIPTTLHFDAENAILIYRYLDDYQNLYDFYQQNEFPTEISAALGRLLAVLHKTTFDRAEHRDFLTAGDGKPLISHIPDLIRSMERIGPEVFGMVPVDGLRFFALYQRYDSLGQAMAELSEVFTPCCLTHNDLKLNNVLVKVEGREAGDDVVRFIDWERAAWGDPAGDLGSLIASYLQLWLSSLVVSRNLSIEESLRLATVPLELLRPSLSALLNGYLNVFTDIQERRPNFLRLVIQFAGFALIQQIAATIEYAPLGGRL